MSLPVRISPSAEPNVTPMIDVLLVLLIVFMMAVVQVHHSMDVQLPQNDVAVTDARSTAIVLEILPGPAYRINRRDTPARELYAQLSAIYSARPEKVLYVSGAPKARYEDVVAAMDVAKAAGVKVLGVVPRGVAP